MTSEQRLHLALVLAVMFGSPAAGSLAESLYLTAGWLALQTFACGIARFLHHRTDATLVHWTSTALACCGATALLLNLPIIDAQPSLIFTGSLMLLALTAPIAAAASPKTIAQLLVTSTFVFVLVGLCRQWLLPPMTPSVAAALGLALLAAVAALQSRVLSAPYTDTP